MTPDEIKKALKTNKTTQKAIAEKLCRSEFGVSAVIHRQRISDYIMRGVADAIMSRLIEETLAVRRTTMRLETGTRSFAAIRFYQRWGFQPCEIYEPYASMPPQAIAASLFFERKAQVQ